MTTPATTTPLAAPPGSPTHLLVVSESRGDGVALVDPERGVMARIQAGAAPWGLARVGSLLYVATAEGVAVIHLGSQERMALVPYLADVGPPRFGEYRPGGMGIAPGPDGRQIYVGVYLQGQPSRLEILDTERLAMVGSVAIGVRPFDLLVRPDGQEVYAIDHDSFSVTVVDPTTQTARTLEAAPLGRGAFDKPHYAALAPDGRLWLPYQGRLLMRLEPASGQFETFPLAGDTHQHGVALAPDGRTLLVVGTGPAGGARSGPSLTLFDIRTFQEEVLPLDRPHEDLALSPDGRFAYLTGGYSLAGGWEGVTAFDRQERTFREVAVAGYPLGILVLPPEVWRATEP